MYSPALWYFNEAEIQKTHISSDNPKIKYFTYISILLIIARFSATRFGSIPRKQSRICQVSVVFCFTSSIPLHSKINHLNANLQMERMAGQSGCRATTKREFKQNIRLPF